MKKLLGILAVSVTFLTAQGMEDLKPCNTFEECRAKNPYSDLKKHLVTQRSLIDAIESLSGRATAREKQAIKAVIKGLRDGVYTKKEGFDFWREIWMRVSMKPNPESDFENITCQLSTDEVNGTIYGVYCMYGKTHDHKDPQNNGKTCTCGLYKSPLGDNLIRTRANQ